MAKRYLDDDRDDLNWELNQERAFWEKMLNQKINYFLGFFVILIVGMAVATTKELSIFVLAVGTVILWALSISIMNTTRKINLAVKELSKASNNPTGLVDRRAKGRIARLIYGFGLPIFCSSVITLILAASLSGIYSFRFPTTKQEVVKTAQKIVEKGKEAVVEKKKPVENNSSHFESIESVIQKEKNPVVSLPASTSIKDTSVKGAKPASTIKKKTLANPNFKNINRVVATEEVYATDKPAKVKKPGMVSDSQKKMDNPNFKNIDTLIKHNIPD